MYWILNRYPYLHRTHSYLQPGSISDRF